MDDGLRVMTMDDLPRIAELEEICFSSPWSLRMLKDEIGNKDTARYFVIELGGMVVAYGGFWKILDEGHITNIAVHPDFRRQGLGQQLVSGMMRRAAAEGINMMTLEVRKSGTEAQRLYERAGFIAAGVRRNYYRKPVEDALIMWNEDINADLPHI